MHTSGVRDYSIIHTQTFMKWVLNHIIDTSRCSQLNMNAVFHLLFLLNAQLQWQKLKIMYRKPHVRYDGRDAVRAVKEKSAQMSV